jgi:hypothetical protein
MSSAVMTSVLASATRTVFVCFAMNPMALQQVRPPGCAPGHKDRLVRRHARPRWPASTPRRSRRPQNHPKNLNELASAWAIAHPQVWSSCGYAQALVLPPGSVVVING